jgi:hypothetical protein
MKLDYYTPQKFSLFDPRVRRWIARVLIILAIFDMAIALIPMRFYLWIGRF